MNIEIEFINEYTVRATTSLEWLPARPAAKLRRTLYKNQVIDEFKKQYPSYEVKQTEGPDKISNFREEEQSTGNWVLTVSEKIVHWEVNKKQKSSSRRRSAESKKATSRTTNKSKEGA